MEFERQWKGKISEKNPETLFNRDLRSWMCFSLLNRILKDLAILKKYWNGDKMSESWNFFKLLKT